MNTLLIMWAPGLKEVNREAVNSASGYTPQLILEPRSSLLLSKGLNPRETTPGTSTDSLPIGNTGFFP